MVIFNTDNITHKEVNGCVISRSFAAANQSHKYWFSVRIPDQSKSKTSGGYTEYHGSFKEAFLAAMIDRRDHVPAMLSNEFIINPKTVAADGLRKINAQF